jgi:hypothetical protein
MRRSLTRLLRPLVVPVALLAWLERPAFAETAPGPRPVIVEYFAPSECGTNDAFQTLVKTEIARSPNADRPWRFSVRIRRRSGVYQGDLTTETGARRVTASTCDDVTAALAVIIAVAAPEPEPEPSPPPAPSPPETIAPTPAAMVPSPGAETGRPGHSPESGRPDWRIGGRGVSTDKGEGTIGGLGTASIELPWGLRKTMFELGLGAFSAWPRIPYQALGTWTISYLVLDTQACLVDLPLGRTGLSILGCLRLAGATFQTTSTFTGPYRPESGATFTAHSGTAVWAGAGARLRWQTPLRVFLEANAGLNYGTVSGAANGGEGTNPGFIDLGAGVGILL